MCCDYSQIELSLEITENSQETIHDAATLSKLLLVMENVFEHLQNILEGLLRTFTVKFAFLDGWEFSRGNFTGGIFPLVVNFKGAFFPGGKL